MGSKAEYRSAIRSRKLIKTAFMELAAEKEISKITVKDIADAVAFLASEQASYITGHVLSVNGGMYM